MVYKKFRVVNEGLTVFKLCVFDRFVFEVVEPSDNTVTLCARLLLVQLCVLNT
jgi:hypothetical protein